MEAIGFYRDFLQHKMEQNLELVTKWVDQKVDDAMNNKLCAPITNDEIEQALFSGTVYLTFDCFSIRQHSKNLTNEQMTPVRPRNQLTAQKRTPKNGSGKTSDPVTLYN